MKRLSAVLLGLILSAPAIHGVFAETSPGDVTGLVTVESAHDVPTTVDRLVTAAEAKGLTIFARIDHAAGAEEVGMELPPMQLVIFGTAKVGTPLMQCDRTAGIDLPLKALIWEDSAGEVWFSYNTPDYLARRHGITEMKELVQKMESALSSFAKVAPQP